MELYAVRERRGGPWDWARGLREQAGFDDHARFMDELVEAGFILLGGPLEGDREVLLVVSAPSADAIRERLAADPWLQDGTLSIVSIERWAILLQQGRVRRLDATETTGKTVEKVQMTFGDFGVRSRSARRPPARRSLPNLPG